jgi:two-component system NtrC family sensor kinase
LEAKQLDSAKKYIDKSFSYPPSPLKAINASGFDFAGQVQAGLKNYDSALLFYRKGIQTFLELKQIYRGLPKIYNSLGVLLNTMGQKDSALLYLHKSLTISERRNFGKEILDAKMRLAQVHESNDVDSALYYYKQAMDSREILYNQQMQRQIASYKFDIELQQQQAANAQTQFRNQVKIYALLGVALVLLTVGFILWRANDRRKKSFALLEKQKAETDFQKDKAEQTIKVLKATQAQLIQSEKMASLGELTAGIAHEIQNPLNFVNNFSEVNKELIAEMDEAIRNGNLEEVKGIAKNIADNQEKINQHGRQADAIVKNMLQHSRKSTGQKEPIDINALCEEYLRLAYHGIRAKDKSFNAKFEIHSDSSVGKIYVVPEDMGRVMLNLINNAFYAVNERSKRSTNDYEPTVTLTTKKTGERIFISVKDSGNGIPDAIKDKIFQPFFTTKPAGQGTGLGLSLSYDIVKTHGGELRVETVEGEGSEFIVSLPVEKIM